MDNTVDVKPGCLFLIPNIIADNTENDVIGARVKEELSNIQYFLAENIRTARRYLKSLNVYESIEPLQFQVLNKDTEYSELDSMCQPLKEGHHMGVVSESGCPGIADPGALAVRYAHNNNIRVIPLVGPSSLLLALMASGLNGQRFAFHGYLPIEQKESARTIKELEKESRQRNQSQLFIETPYRSSSLFRVLLNTLGGNTLLCVAVNITSPSENIKTRSVNEWKTVKYEVPKEPVVFLFLAK